MSKLNSFAKNKQKSKNTLKPNPKLDNNKKLTHLYMHDKYLRTISDLSQYENLQVLYMHNNEIYAINNLEPLVNLKHLYLQNNKITRISGLNTLRHLKKLYLSCNEVSVIEGLEKLNNLEELHIEKQKLSKGESLCFDPRSIFTLSESLMVLNVSHNNLSTIEGLAPLKRLRNLDASFNNIADMVKVTNVLQNWFNLIEVNFTGNPMTKQYRYKDTLIVNTLRLAILDKKDINETTRTFMKRFELEKGQNRGSYPGNINVRNLPGTFPPTLHQVVSNSLIKNFSSSMITKEIGDESKDYVPWNALKSSVSDTGRIIPPLFLRHQKAKNPEKARKVHFAPN